MLLGALATTWVDGVALGDRLVFALILSLASLFVTLTFLAWSWPWRLATLAAYGFTGLLVLAPLTGGWVRTIAVAAIWAELVLLFVPGLLLLTIRRLRPMLIVLAALLVFVVLLIAMLIPIMLLLGPYNNEDQIVSDMHESAAWVWFVGILNFLGGAVLLQRLLRSGRSRGAIARVFGLAIGIVLVAGYLVVGPLQAHPLATTLILVAIIGPVVCTLQWFLVWLVFKLFVRVQDRHLLTPRVLHYHLCCAALTMIVASPSIASGEYVTVMLCLATLGVEVLILHLLLRREWMQRKLRPARRLLLLRVFGQAGQREKLLDWLDDGWRHVGRVDLIAGTDLAMRTLGSRMLEAFLLQRVEAEYLNTPEDVNHRLSRMRSELESDLRYPVNEVYCYENTWKLAVGQLALDADAVLMDLRGFSRANAGCVFELEYLIREVHVGRILLIADRTTDVNAVTETLNRAWHSLPAEALARQRQNPEIAVMKLAGRRAIEKEALNRYLYQIAFGRP